MTTILKWGIQVFNEINDYRENVGFLYIHIYIQGFYIFIYIYRGSIYSHIYIGVLYIHIYIYRGSIYSYIYIYRGSYIHIYIYIQGFYIFIYIQGLYIFIYIYRGSIYSFMNGRYKILLLDKEVWRALPTDRCRVCYV